MDGRHMGEQWQSPCFGNLVAHVVQLRDSPHALLPIEDQPEVGKMTTFNL
jgi:hypothetical protein